MLNHLEAIDKNKNLILETERYIWNNAETGYREIKTSKHLEEIFTRLGYKINKAENIPGFYCTVDTGRSGPEVLILAEMDSVICKNHPEANKETGAVHSCGHNTQCAALVGIAAALTKKEVLCTLSGKIKLCAVPAEELIETEYRKKLKDESKINFFTGKLEFLYRGYFDTSDIALMFHTTTSQEINIEKGTVGCLVKKIIYEGKSAHAGGNPWDGKNALYAANLGLSAINSIRETFKDSELIRVHPIMTSGGNTINAIPDIAIIESYVKGKSINSIKETNKKVNRALCGAALSLGNNISIYDTHGYSPLNNCVELCDIAEKAAEDLKILPVIRTDNISPGSTDLGDLSQIMPSLHPYFPGAKGTTHGADYEIVNPTLACVSSAKYMMSIIRLLLGDNAVRAKRIVKNYKPNFKSKDEFLKFIDSMSADIRCIDYSNENNIHIKIQ